VEGRPTARSARFGPTHPWRAWRSRAAACRWFPGSPAGRGGPAVKTRQRPIAAAMLAAG